MAASERESFHSKITNAGLLWGVWVRLITVDLVTTALVVVVAAVERGGRSITAVRAVDAAAAGVLV